MTTSTLAVNPAILPLCALLALAGSAAGAAPTDVVTDERAAHHEHATPAAAAPMPGNSLYRLPVHFTTAGGEHLMLQQYRGQPVVVTMFYGSCKSACPLLTHAMLATAASLPATARGRVRFLMVSLDPGRDTEAELARFTQEYQLPSPRFEVARTDTDGVRLLAAALGIRYRQLPDGNFSHSSILTALDSAGVPQARTENIAGADSEFVTTVSGLVQ